jgi:hypothetical protein
LKNLATELFGFYVRQPCMMFFQQSDLVVVTYNLSHHPQKLYVYPTLDKSTGRLVTARDLRVDPSVQLLYDYILQRGTIVPIEGYDAELLKHGDVSKRVQELLRAGSHEWESMVPRHVANQIKSQELLGYRVEQAVGRQQSDCEPV